MNSPHKDRLAQVRALAVKTAIEQEIPLDLFEVVWESPQGKAEPFLPTDTRSAEFEILLQIESGKLIQLVAPDIKMIQKDFERIRATPAHEAMNLSAKEQTLRAIPESEIALQLILSSRDLVNARRTIQLESQKILLAEVEALRILPSEAAEILVHSGLTKVGPKGEEIPITSKNRELPQRLTPELVRKTAANMREGMDTKSALRLAVNVKALPKESHQTRSQTDYWKSHFDEAKNTIGINAATTQPQQTRGAIHHEIGHAAYDDEGVRSAIKTLYQSLSPKLRDLIQKTVSSKYRDNEREEESHIYGFEAISSDGPKELWKKLLKEVSRVWNRITNQDSMQHDLQKQIVGQVLREGINRLKNRKKNQEIEPA